MINKLNERLKLLRKNLTQKELATKTGIPYANYNKYETTNIIPDLQTLCKLADFYNVTLDYLVGRDFTNPIGYLTDNQITFVKSFLALNLDNQMNAVIFVSNLLANQK